MDLCDICKKKIEDDDFHYMVICKSCKKTYVNDSLGELPQVD